MSLREDAKKLAKILIQLRKDYPLFLKDYTNGPDPDMNIGFKTYEELKNKKIESYSNDS
jgi:hypothetical protein